ncbi:glycosyl hydrolase family 61-domain-containing protein [Apodospora peruviana]|uniref:lytic cellulose monooxygenase (C4-dehydrogenating) n=1 Tax=Apodospora peruviana TaxID=516989 RepID=A0AAE0ID40_9PEZI|nr:glycosyl hydrolase family 61-domain-containing protein [Apodospora peruviana]
MKNCAATFPLAAGLLALAQYVAGHATFQQSAHGSVDDGKTCVRMPPSNSPVTDITSSDMACNVGGSKGVAGVCEATAGDTFTVEMHQQSNDRSCATEAIGGNHFGPVLIYMSKVTDATSADGSSGSWFKVDEFGYSADNKTWGTDLLNANCGKRTFKIPSKIPAGDYLVRAEAIALHAAGQKGGAQAYMSCYQVKVASSTSPGQVPAGVKIPGAYSATDPGILVDIYGSSFKSYTIPGPAVIDQSFF